MNDSARRLQRFEDTMAKYYGEMERILYAAEIACLEAKGYTSCCGCAFYRGCIVGSNKCNKFRELFGDHVKQDDVMPRD